jgi:hypothetical protein
MWWELSRHGILCFPCVIHQQDRKDQRKLSRFPTQAFSSKPTPRQPVTTSEVSPLIACIVNDISPQLHRHCNLFLPASIRMWVSWSTSGIRRDEVSMSRVSFSHLHSCSSSSFIRNSCLRVSSSIIMRGSLRYFCQTAKQSSYWLVVLLRELDRSWQVVK